MVSKEDLSKKYGKLSNPELMEIIDNKSQYTAIAVTVATEELAKRDLTENDIAKHKNKAITGYYDAVEKNFVDDISTGQKLFFFYFFWIDAFGLAIKNNFVRDGYMLKRAQAAYFSRMGMLCLMVSIFLMLALDFHSYVHYVLFGLAGLLTLYYDATVRKQNRALALRNLYKEQEDFTPRNM